MNRIFYNTLIFLSALFIGGVAIIFSIQTGSSESKIETGSNEKVWSKIFLNSSQPNVYTAREEVVDIKNTKISPNTPMLVDFGRLSSMLYLAPSGPHE
jgi:hypothetical protein